MSGSVTYRPRCAAILVIPPAGQIGRAREAAEDDRKVVIDLNIHRAELTSSDHNSADELEVETSWEQSGLDPRVMSAGTISFHLGDADEDGNFTPSRDNLRFIGVCVFAERILDETSKRVRLKFQDYTCLFLQSKPFPSDGIPDLSQTLEDAWARICDHTGYYDLDEKEIVSSVPALRNRLRIEGNAKNSLLLGDAVTERFRKVGKIEPGLNKSSWEVWQHCVGSVGLISFVQKDEVVVTDAVAYYTSSDPPRMVWGQNVRTLKEERDANRAGKFVGLMSINPLTGASIEAFWPPRDKKNELQKQKATKRAGKPGKHRTTKKATAGDGLIPITEYEMHPYPYGVTNVEMLTWCAQRVYEERSRQELTGSLTTREMVVGTEKGAEFDILNVMSGDVIRVEFEVDTRGELASLGSDAVRVQYLQDIHGYSYEVARILVQNLSDLGSLPPYFMVRKVHTTLEFNGDSGTFDVSIDFCNRIQQTGAAVK